MATTARFGYAFPGVKQREAYMTAWWQRPEPEKPAWRTRGGHDYQVGDPFGFEAMGLGRWAGTVIERAPNDWLRIRVESATGRFAGLEGRIVAGPIWGLEPEPESS